MRRLGLAAGLCIWASAALAAGDFGPMNSVNDAFNGAAKAFGAKSRMLLVTCAPDRGACQFSVSGKITGVSKGGAGTKGKAGTIALLYGKDSEAQEFVLALGVAMAAWSPKADKDERGLALSSLVEAVTKEEAREVVLAGTRYRLVSAKAEDTIILTMTKD